MPSDEWLPPAQAEATRTGTPWLKMLVAVVLGVMVVSGLRWYTSRPGAVVDGPQDALRSWLRAAETGDPDAVRRTVAPSQRRYVSDADPTGTGVDELHVESLVVTDFSAGNLSPDEGYLTVRGAVCPEATGGDGGRDPRCRDLTGSGAEDLAMVVREQGRWWAVAAPVRLLPRQRPPVVTSVITQRLELRGGLEGTFDATQEVLDRSCRNVGTVTLSFRSESGADLEDEVRVQLSSFAGSGASGGEVVDPGQVSLAAGRHSWQPAQPVRIERTADNASGSLVIEAWRSRPVFDDPPRPPVSGRLTWTCRDDR